MKKPMPFDFLLDYLPGDVVVYYIPAEYYHEGDFRIKLLKATGVEVGPIDIKHGVAYYKYIIDNL